MSLGYWRGLRSSESAGPSLCGGKMCVVSEHPELTALGPPLHEDFINIFAWDHMPGLLGRAILTQLGIWENGTSQRAIVFLSLLSIGFNGIKDH